MSLGNLASKAFILALLCSAVSAYAQLSAPAHNRNKYGYLILTSTAYKGNQVNDANCLNEVLNSGWKGKGQAGSLTSTRVHTFACTDSTCPALKANSYYAFAKAGSTTIGGSVISTDSSGLGPNDANTWQDNNHFGTTTVTYWTGGRDSLSTTKWSGVPAASNAHCSNWTDGISGTGDVGSSNHTDDLRWNDFSNVWGCSNSLPMICLVDPG